MRLGATVLLQDQTCIQSYSWTTQRPLGGLQQVISSLEEYECDEISIIRPIRAADTFDDFRKDIQLLGSLNTMTPISFGGGIRSLEHLKLIKNLPIERLVFSSAMLEKNDELINAAKNLFGHQAIKCALPFRCLNGDLDVYHSAREGYLPIKAIDLEYIDKHSNEIVLIDSVHEGCRDSFDWDALSSIPICIEKLIISGGIGKNCSRLAREKNVASVLVDNKVLHAEYSIRGYKNG